MPRPPDQPVVEEDQEENRRRDEVTVGELAREALEAGEDLSGEPATPFDATPVIERIGAERWEELRARRDRLLEALRQLREQGGGLRDG